ncbi:MAG: alpha/beta fold hydrolase, partial [Anaerolineae bacterium]|nr:alpha/beta fold hydrolase [Anaerolineae bacterium]
MPYVDLATGARFEYVDAGDGPPLIALHGMLGTAHRHLGAVIDWLSADYRVLAPNLRGYGESRPKPRDFPNDFYQRDARDGLAFMDALGIERARLIGFSDGGEVALLMAAMQPERFAAVAVWGATGYFGPILRDVVTAPGYAPSRIPGPELMRLHGILDAEAFVQGWIAAVLHMVDAGGDISLGVADRISAPLLLLLGRQDVLNPAEYASRLVARAPHARLELFDCGHAIHREAQEAFMQTVGDFLAAEQAMSEVALRDVQASDLDVFFTQQLDPAANYMAAFTAPDPADRAAFLAHWERILADECIDKRTIVVDGVVAGHVVRFKRFGLPEVSYWLGREFWGRGIATRALAIFLGEYAPRPLYARTAKDNTA